MCNKGLIEAVGGKLLNFMLFIFVLLFPPHPTPLPFSCICGNAIHYACDGVCVSRGACMCNKKLIEAVGGKLFIFMLFSFGE